MSIYEYVGCFFDCEELFSAVSHLRREPLKNEKKKPHVTFLYAPSEVDTSLFGTEIEATVTGYGNDGENEGLLVTLSCREPRLAKDIEKIAVPHITLAVSDSGQAVNTKRLSFSPVAPVKITGHYGGHIDN